MEEFKRLSRDLVHKGAIIDYYQDTIQVPNGNVVKWDFIRHNGAAAVVPIDAQGRLIMVRQYRNALDRETLEIPAGGLNGTQEPTRDAAARELAEETGYHAEKLELLLTICTTVAFCNEKIDIYVATGLTPGRQHLDEDEYVDVKAYELDELIAKILAGEIQDSKTVAAILAYKEKYRNR
jgi:ADP-ribose pyrophosphatase